MNRERLEALSRVYHQLNGNVVLEVVVLRQIIASALGENDAYERGRADQFEECRHALAEALDLAGSWSALVLITKNMAKRLRLSQAKESV